MHSAERFFSTLERKPVDRVPMFDFLFQRPMYAQLIGETPGAYNARHAVALTKALGLDSVWVPFGAFSGWSPERLSADVYRDEWGTTFQTNAASWPIDAPVDFPIKTLDDLAAYVPPDPAAPGRLDELKSALAATAALPDPPAVIGGVAGPLTAAWMLLGYEAICFALYDEPELVSGAVAINEKYALSAIDRMADIGIKALFVSEDLGSSCGGLLSPAHFREYLYPSLGRIAARIRERGMFPLLHSCGRIYEFLDSIVELGFAAVHPLQRTAGMDLAKVKREYGGRIVIVGNIDSSRTLPYGTPEDVRREVREALAAAKPGGGYILASDHSLHDGIPVENIVAMFDACREFGAY